MSYNLEVKVKKAAKKSDNNPLLFVHGTGPGAGTTFSTIFLKKALIAILRVSADTGKVIIIKVISYEIYSTEEPTLVFIHGWS